ncbi:ABC-2 family transporter protein [uncultured archaeon]|nr:ABC-2 family transporter protein [uncultured archaeon]
MTYFNLQRVGVVALRIIRQLKRDRRTIGLITLAPIFLMFLFGYALSGEMSGVRLGLVDEGGHAILRSHLVGTKDFEIQYLGSESDADKLITEGQLDGAVILLPGGIKVLKDASSLQISDNILAQVNAGIQQEMASSIGKPRFVLTQRYVYGYDLDMIQTVGPAVLGLVVFFFTFIIGAISFLRERLQGTFEKLMVSPLSRIEMISGYILGFSLFAMIQSATTLLVVVFAFNVPMKGNPLLAFAIVLFLAAGALALGSFLSNFARSEFQVVQFIPIVIIPQIVLCGVFWPLQSVPEFLRPLSYILPLTYSSEALRAVMLKGDSLLQILPDLLFLSGFIVVMFIAATLMLQRR